MKPRRPASINIEGSVPKTQRRRTSAHRRAPIRPQGQRPPKSTTDESSLETDRSDLLRRATAIIGNVGVLSALLVYFGWVRSEVLARNLGIDESLLGMSTREYMLRSVRPVLVLLIVVAASGLLWVALDLWLARRWSRGGPEDRPYRWSIRLMPFSIIVFPLCAVAFRTRFPVLAYISFPLLCAAGLLLLLYAFHLRSRLPGALTLSAQRESLVRVCAAALVGVSLFSAAANYATYEGNHLAQGFNQRLASLPEVVVHSTTPLNIEAPGVQTGRVDGESGYRFRYEGLRLLEKTGGQYFLISDTWTPEYGIVIALKDNDPALRYEFIRDTRG